MKTKLFSVELSNEAEVDFDSSYEYYFEESPTVADAFFQKLNFAFNIIKQNPYSFSIIHKNIRKYVIKKFPFVIYYTVNDPIIKVIAIFHTSRHPEIWNDRI